MQQLTLQFDGYADSRPVIDVSATKRRFSEALAKAVSKLLLPLQAIAIMAFCFGIMFLAAIIQG